MSEPIVEVVWHDAWTEGGETTRPHQWASECECRSVGYLVEDTPELISLALEMSPEDSPSAGYRWVLHIPKVLIVSKKVIRR